MLYPNSWQYPLINYLDLDSIKSDDLPIEEFEGQFNSEIKQEDNYEFTEFIECDVEIKEEPSGKKIEPIELDFDSDWIITILTITETSEKSIWYRPEAIQVS